jgi:F-type H+-transporting ATPase subunit epsilon
MDLRILLPFEVFTDRRGVARIVAETRGGAFGILPQRLDCVAALPPGILTYEIDGEGERYVAVDEGVLVKAGREVLVSVRRALAGPDLARLRDAVVAQYLTLNEREQSVRSVLMKMEGELLHRLADLDRD